ncbi:Hypothetical protein NTJ_02741 [Nesidiocoris tenuis]|uniref:G-protein coupled receptors family 1 profile domain-containing protein n=1 Tax=Nesidiocoris tenuis TaxID=355587 RepID=A0ABN7ACB9_9HEMI|nr:Hypothetical protein NTJ_02741 [Nesidiocoris tenuis]
MAPTEAGARRRPVLILSVSYPLGFFHSFAYAQVDDAPGYNSSSCSLFTFILFSSTSSLGQLFSVLLHRAKARPAREWGDAAGGHPYYKNVRSHRTRREEKVVAWAESSVPDEIH